MRKSVLPWLACAVIAVIVVPTLAWGAPARDGGGSVPVDRTFYTGDNFFFDASGTDTQDNSIASYRYPDDPREDLDYVLHRAGHAKPSGWTNKVVKEQSEPWTVSSWGTDYTYTNLSDHYPLIGSVG